jgi:hypothetical protein
MSEAEKEAHRRANRAYARRKKARDPEGLNQAHRESWNRHKNRKNESRRAKGERDWAKEKRRILRQMLNVFGDHIRTASLVSARAIREDLTRWKGPGAKKTAALEKQADKLLRKKP